MAEMSALSSPAVTIGDGEIIIAAELLAPKLGLSTEALKAEMRRGYVYSLAERGIDEDAGRTRLTFRYRKARGPWLSSPWQKATMRHQQRTIE